MILFILLIVSGTISGFSFWIWIDTFNENALKTFKISTIVFIVLMLLNILDTIK